MKARIKGTDDPFREIYTIEIKGVDGLYSAEDIEFEQKQELTSDHWQDVRERVAIAAMQSFLSFGNTYKYMTSEGCADNAIRYADALVKKLKGE